MLTTAGVRVVLAVMAAAAVSTLSGQSAISARSGMVHYIDGDVFIADKAVELKHNVFSEVVKENEILRTAEGRAEVLLTPGVFLRLSENSSFKMISSRLSDTRVEALTGTVLLEAGELAKDNAITLLFKDQTIAIEKNGLYRLDADKGLFRVYNGEAIVSRGGQTFTVKQARSLQLDGTVLTAEKFDNKVGDEFFRWAARRSSYLSMANVAAAKQVYDSGNHLTSSQWAYNPWFGMFTYLPYRGSYMSPFGYGFWSPSRIMGVLPGYGYGYGNYGNYNYGNNGYNSGGGASASNGHYDSSVGYNTGGRGTGFSTPSNGGSYNGGGVSGGSSGMGASAPARSSDGGGARGGGGAPAAGGGGSGRPR